MATHPLYLGMISGTSADAIDLVLLEGAERPRVLAAMAAEYPPDLRDRVLALNAGDARISLDELGGLDTWLGAVFADAVLHFLRERGIEPAQVCAIGSHGQTVRHRPRLAHAFSMQLGNPHVIAERTGITTVADFRRRDVAAGGEGAPLLPAFHALLWGGSGEDRAVLNLGGIANLTLLPAEPNTPVTGFDTGPANCLLDAWCQRRDGQRCDPGGRRAQEGRVNGALLQRWLRDPYFAQPPPKSTGREYFDLNWMVHSEAELGAMASEDVLATLVELSVRTVCDALRRAAPRTRQLLVCGGGVHNRHLMARLAAELDPIQVSSTAQHGIDPDFVEAAAFAWLAQRTLHRQPGNLPSVTGARGLRVLGAIHLGSQAS